MSDYRRNYVHGGTYFFTVVTFNRRPLFREASACKLLGQAMRAVQQEYPFKTLATVLLPDHLHALWTLPHGDKDYSKRWQRIKREFTCAFLEQGGTPYQVSASQQSHGNKGVWQRRFWEHTVRDEDELGNFCDYIHFNPVKHGYVSSVADWPHSTFHRFVAAGEYEPGWGRSALAALAKLDYEYLE